MIKKLVRQKQPKNRADYLLNLHIWRKLANRINQFQPSFTFHTETSHFFCNENKMTGFDMKCNTGPKWDK